ncbi:MAG: hypothetical protein R2761_02870 [Acidimicrobiales bacterium]
MSEATAPPSSPAAMADAASGGPVGNGRQVRWREVALPREHGGGA